jgi:hypothetical protein
MWRLDGPVELLECDETVDVIRQGRKTPDCITYVDGVALAAAAPTRVRVVATLQPMAGKDLLLVPEGFRDKETLWMWQAHRIEAQGDFRLDLTDLVLYSGKAYQVQSSEDWGSYTRSMLVACDTGAYVGAIDAANPPAVYPALLE